MKEVNGFLTNDGVFFEREMDARLFEARQHLIAKYQSSLWKDIVPVTELLSFIETFSDQTIEYLEAYKDVTNLQPSTAET